MSADSPHHPAVDDPELRSLSFPVVGIGSSAGGLQAVKQFFKHMPSDSGMAFVVIFHLSPEHQSVADKLIQEATTMPVLQVTRPVAIQSNNVYVISPGHSLGMEKGQLQVGPTLKRDGLPVTIDLFFRDLARVHQARAVGVVLSGTGSDGALGLARIKEEGGVTLAQTPEDAEFSAMPQAAIATHMVDMVMPVADMPRKLVQLWHNSRHIHLPTASDPELTAFRPVAERDAAAAEQALQDILSQLRSATGHDFKHYKRATVLRRIERRMQVCLQPDLLSYLGVLHDRPEETRALLGDMLIGVTNFFRDREAFEALERTVLPHLLEDAQAKGEDHEIRVWSAGCSTGEEPYSLAMLLIEQLQRHDNKRRLQIFATDIDERAIKAGRAGLYSPAIAIDVPSTRLRQFFHKEEANYRVRKEVREKVLFAKHSLLCDPPFSQIDLIVCRNLLIYLDREVQREILQMFHFALRPGGTLFLGSSESADACGDLFTAVDKRQRIFRARTGTAASRRAPTVPRGGYVRNERVLEAPKSESPRRLALADIHQRALARTAPPSLIVDTNADILHMTAEAGRYLRHAGGEVSRNLLALIDPDLRVEVRTALFQVQQTNSLVRSRRVVVQGNDQRLQVLITAAPYKDAETEGDYVLVMFEEAPLPPGHEEGDSQVQTENQVVHNLERELQRTKLQLQETIEQSEVSSEELKASNEEMQAINEELRSATEELETSKEELQSMNEELLTVNYELKTKVEETDKVNDYLTNLIASTDIATVFVDRSMRIKWFTPRATEIFSMLPVDTGRSLFDITHRLDYEDLPADAASVFESLTIIEREVRSSDNRWYIARLLPYRSSENHIDGTVLTFIDITKRRAAEQYLRLSEERLRLVAESTHDYAIIIQDEHGIISHWNTGAQLMFGYSKDEAQERFFDFLFTPQDRAAGVPAAELLKARHEGRVEDERWYQRKDGSQFYCSSETTVLEGENFRGAVKIARDLTEHKQLHDQQSRGLAQALTSSDLKDEFFAVMSHELKHPLNLIQLNADLLYRLPLTRELPLADKAVHTIQEAVRSQARIIDDLLDVARVRTGKLKLERMQVDLRKVLQDIHAVVAHAPGQCDVHLQQATDSPPLILDADPVRVEQVVWNLVNNAIKFTPASGRVQLHASRDGDLARLDVIDNGHGLAPQDLDRVFELFGQAAHQHASYQRDGLGIGLSLVRQLAEAHGGRVQVQSAGIGHGCTFSVWLPLHCDKPAQLSVAATPTAQLATVRVLLVDDSPEVLSTLQALLEMEGGQVQAFTDPLQALTAAGHATYDVIVSDLGMPGMNGHQLLKAIRETTRNAATPAIALTGMGPGQPQAGGADFVEQIGKPVPYIELIEAILRVTA